MGSFSGELGSVLCDVEIIGSLEAKEEWEKLECWLGAIWIVQPLEDEQPLEEIIRVTAALFDQVPAAVQKLRDWVAYSEEGSFGHVHVDEFRRICGLESGEEQSASYL